MDTYQGDIAISLLHEAEGKLLQARKRIRKARAFPIQMTRIKRIISGTRGLIDVLHEEACYHEKQEDDDA